MVSVFVHDTKIKLYRGLCFHYVFSVKTRDFYLLLVCVKSTKPYYDKSSLYNVYHYNI